MWQRIVIFTDLTDHYGSNIQQDINKWIEGLEKDGSRVRIDHITQSRCVLPTGNALLTITLVYSLLTKGA